MAALTRVRGGGMFPTALAMVSLALFAQIILFPMRVTGDVSMFLDAGDRVLQGQLPFVDIQEINVPINHYLNAIPAFIARTLSINPVTPLLLLIGLGVTGTAFAVAGILRGRADAQGDGGADYLLSFVIVVFAQIQLLILNYGQREHLFTLGLVLWLVLRWQRWKGRRFHPGFAFAVGVCAAVAVTLKPHFLPFALVIELWGVRQTGGLRSLRSAEVAGALFVAAVYCAYLAVFPQLISTYWQEILPWIRTGYSGYGYVPPMELLSSEPSAILQLGLCLIPWVWQGKSPASLWGLARPLSLLVVGGALHYALQAKGWAYHRVPFDFFSVLLFTVIAERALTDRRGLLRMERGRLQFILRVTGAAVWLVVTGVSIGVMAYSPNEMAVPMLTEAMRRYSSPGDTILTVDDYMSPVWPGIHQAGLWQASRYLPAFVFPISYYGVERESIYDPAHIPPEAIQRYVQALGEDIEHYRPSVIMIRTNKLAAPTDPEVDLYRFLEGQGVMRDVILPDYDFAEEVLGYRFYVLRQNP